MISFRFNTREDAIKAINCMKKGEPLPTDLPIQPLVQKDGRTRFSGEWINAPYEVQFRIVERSKRPVNNPCKSP